MKIVVIEMAERKAENLKIICGFLVPEIRKILENLPPERVENLCEIRLRASKPIVLIFTNERLFVTSTGRLTQFCFNDPVTVTAREVEDCFTAMCRYSVHSLSGSIANGFITLDGGSRVGVYGTAVTDGEKITSVRSVCGLNIRLSGDFRGIAAPIARRLYSNGCVNTLICGPPASGKTTALRDLCRILSDEKGLKVCIVDERGETDGCNTGVNTDVLCGYPKAAGIQLAVRTLSPEVVAFDEIGTLGELEAVREGMNSGVHFIMTIHCSGREELERKPQYRLLSQSGMVDACVFYKNVGELAEIVERESQNETTCFNCARSCLCADGSLHSVPNEYACIKA